MRLWIRLTVVMLLAALIALGICHALQQEDTQPAGSSGAAIGLMLLEKGNGLYVLAVTQDSIADRAGVLPGDYILRVEEEDVADAARLEEILSQSRAPLALTLRRDGKEVPVTLPAR